MKKLFAFSLLGACLVRHFFLSALRWLRKALGGAAPDGKARFMANFDADGIRPLTKAEADIGPLLQRCIRCGLCDALCGHTAGIFKGPSYLASTHSRSLPEIVHAGPYLLEYRSCRDCEGCVDICPTGVPIKEVVALVERLGRGR